MWRNYLTVGIRALTKNRAYAVINIAGLAIGMAACLLILIYVQYERSYDKWLPDSERIYQVQTYFQSSTSPDHFEVQAAPYVSRESLAKDFPQIETTTYMAGIAPPVLRNGEPLKTEGFTLVDTPFFDVFPLPMVAGDHSALSTPGTIVLTQSEAIRIFGKSDVLGETLTVVLRTIPTDFRITGVMRDIPKNSHLAIKMLARTDLEAFFADSSSFLTNWGSNGGWVYVRLREGASGADINAQMRAFQNRNIPDDMGAFREELEFALVNARDVHLGKAKRAAMTPANDAKTIATFAIIAMLILGMAAINFTNLATARAGQRAREVALRKVLGANRRQLIMQFLGESVLLAAVAMVLALALAELALPYLASFLDADLALSYLGADSVLPAAVALVLLVGLAGGLYPAFYLSAFQPARILKANKSSAEPQGSGRLRNVLVVGQFAISITLMICTAIIYQQTEYARTLDPGYDRDGLIQIEDFAPEQTYPVMDTILSDMKKVPGVVSIGKTGLGVNTGNDSANEFFLPGDEQPRRVGNYSVDVDFFKTMGIKTVKGRTFEAGRIMDEMPNLRGADDDAINAFAQRGLNVVLNVAATKRLGFSTPEDAIGQQLRSDVGYGPASMLTLNIVGVVADTRQRSSRIPIEPIVFFNNPINASWIVVRYNGDPQAVRDGLEAAWRKHAPAVQFSADFSEAINDRIYRKDEARAQIFAGFATLAIIVGCLGLFGLASFTAERRTKEIGIRKVLGARAQDIVRLLVWQFSKPVLLANLIAWPLAWWAMRDWLNDFDARISLGLPPFLAAALVALAIAVVTIGGHAYRVACENPIKALRYE